LNLESKDVDSTIYYVNDSKVGAQKVKKLTFELKENWVTKPKSLSVYEGQNSEATASRTSVKRTTQIIEL
jgi:hypothetical protein